MSGLSKGQVSLWGGSVGLKDAPSGLWGGRSGFSGDVGSPAPVIILSGPGGVPENSAVNTVIGTLSVANGTGTYTFTKTVDVDGTFNVSGSSLRTSGTWDYETATFHQVTIHADNGAGSVLDRVFSIAVINVLEVTLVALTGTFTLPENSVAGVVAGALAGQAAGSTLSLVNNAGGRVALSGSNVVAGSTPTDYETATSYSFTVRQTHPDGINSPLDTVLTLTVTNVLEVTLGALTLSPTTFNVGVPSSGTIGGAAVASPLSVIALAGGPTGLTINSAARTSAYDGTGSNATGNLTLTETQPDASNSGRVSTIGWTVTGGASLNTPVLTWTSANAVYNPTFSMTEITTGDLVELQVDDNSDFSSPYGDDTNTIDAIEAAGGSITFPAIPTLLAATTYYARARYQRGGTWSGWSASVSMAMAASITPTFAWVDGGLYTRDINAHTSFTFSGLDVSVVAPSASRYLVIGLTLGSPAVWPSITVNGSDASTSAFQMGPDTSEFWFGLIYVVPLPTGLTADVVITTTTQWLGTTFAVISGVNPVPTSTAGLLLTDASVIAGDNFDPPFDIPVTVPSGGFALTFHDMHNRSGPPTGYGVGTVRGREFFTDGTSYFTEIVLSSSTATGVVGLSGISTSTRTIFSASFGP